MEKPKQFKTVNKPEQQVQPLQPLSNTWTAASSTDEIRRQLGWGLVSASRSFH